MGETATEISIRDHFFASFSLPGEATVEIRASSLASLTKTVALLRPTEAVATAKDAPSPPAKAEKTAETKPEKSAKSEPAAPAVATGSASAKADATVAKGDEGVLDYTVLQQAVFKLASVNADAAREVNAQFGVKKMNELPEGKRREALAAVQARTKAEEQAKADAEAVA